MFKRSLLVCTAISVTILTNNTGTTTAHNGKMIEATQIVEVPAPLKNRTFDFLYEQVQTANSA